MAKKGKLRKALIGLGIGLVGLTIVIIVAASVIMRRNAGIWPWEAVGRRVNETEVERKIKEGKIKRSYPEVIKGNWEPSPFRMSRMMSQEVDSLKKLGVNTVSVSVEYEIKKDGSVFLPQEDMVKSNIVGAKENGFAVLVSADFVGSGGPVLKERGVSIAQEGYLRRSTEVAIKWAKIAEKYEVEFFAPQNEFDLMMASNFTGEEHGEGKEAFAIVSQWHKEMLPKLRKVFSGKLMVKMARCPADMDVSGYDYLGITINHGETALETFREDIKKEYLNLSQAASKSNCQWLISEAWMPYGGDFYPETTNQEGKSLDELQDDYFRIATDEYLQFQGNKPSGFIFIAWIMPGMDIKDRLVEKVIKNFFKKI